MHTRLRVRNQLLKKTKAGHSPHDGALCLRLQPDQDNT